MCFIDRRHRAWRRAWFLGVKLMSLWPAVPREAVDQTLKVWTTISSRPPCMPGRRYKMSSVRRDPLRASLPFDRDRSGIVGAEGSVMFVLERGEHAQGPGRGRPGLHSRAMAAWRMDITRRRRSPPVRWERQVMEDALLEAGLNPDDIDAVVAHATGTPAGDTAEIRALNGLFTTPGRAIRPCPSKEPLAIRGRPPGEWESPSRSTPCKTAYCRPPWAPRISIQRSSSTSSSVEPIELRPRAVQINAFGFGGQDASLVVSRS